MSGCPRDLAAVAPWEASLQRSLARRARASGQARHNGARTISALLGAPERCRDLAESELWELSLGRSRARRRAAELQFVPTTSRAKRISLGTLAALTVGPTASLADGQAAVTHGGSPGPTTTTEHVVMLEEGSEGGRVRALQQVLGHIKVDGIFGPETEAAVRAFQAEKGLPVDGVVGPLTAGALSSSAAAVATFTSLSQQDPAEAASAPRASFALATEPANVRAGTVVASDGGAEAPAGAGEGSGAGSAGSAESAAREAAAQAEVKAVQRLQSALRLPTDGEFGPETEAAIRRLQARHGLSVDGVVGPATWRAIGVSDTATLTPPASALPQRRHHHDAAQAEAGEAPSDGGTAAGEEAAAPPGGGSAIKRLQAALRLSPDGEFGPETEAAIRRLQARHGLTVDGVVGPATWRAIGVSDERTLTPPRSAVVRHSSSSAEAGSDESSSSGEGSSSSGGEGVVARVIAAGDEIATRPYVYGGGHGSFQSSGYDCSGSVSYALHGGGLLSSPEDSTALESYGEPGPGRHITIYANSQHAFMVVDGKRFDTVAAAETGSRWSSSMTSTAGYVARHPSGM
jgi:peptidoglycan hydrolase-like protein with peptidoglycan-binding domain